ncbi:DUF6503 family protein [Roseivirga misakiensis]|uniref:Deoxyribose-phosphate aldolase n=1 Tax=Roseivirga misakiensis TaxID=1563681 RepID=A0A1E5SYZ6_9BACT|nr:DUF6503 family protein [Roseivirga misakiensis]OEK04267.1 hypothetical protein BFP71_12345 [Roseivirga misakiensis]
MKNYNLFCVLLVSLIALESCGDSTKTLTVDDIIQKAVARHGGENYDNMEVEFDFRSRHFRAKISDGQYVYERTFRSKDGMVKDVWSNKKFKRMIDQEEIQLNRENMRSYKTATNSVIYFALLPFNLDDPVVNRQLMRSVKIKDKEYYKVEVTYGENGGGEDFEDVYIYWINKDEFTIDYLAYSFNINGGGVRFREAYNAREIEGIRFQDYMNYSIDKDFPAQELDYAFETEQLKLLSKIELENVKVRLQR